MNVGFGYEASTNGAGADQAAAERGKDAGPFRSGELARTRPEILVGAAFAGGVLAALLLRRLGR